MSTGPKSSSSIVERLKTELAEPEWSKNQIQGSETGQKEHQKGSAIQRVLDIIDVVSHSERPLTPTELSQVLDIPKASVHRICGTLESEGFLQVALSGRGMMPGHRLNRVALGVLASSPLRAERHAILQNLSRKIGETCNISIPDGSEMIYFDRAETHWPVRIQLKVGSRVPVHATSAGKMYLSSLSTARRKRILQNTTLKAFTDNTLVDIDKLEAELQIIRERGYSIDDEEYIDGMVALAVPVQDSTGKLYATLSLNAPVMRVAVEQIEQYLGSLLESAKQLKELITE